MKQPENSNVSNMIQVTADKKHSCALINDGTVSHWGVGLNGEHQYTDINAQTSAVQAQSLSGVSHISAGNGFIGATKSTGGVECWGKMI